MAATAFFAAVFFLAVAFFFATFFVDVAGAPASPTVFAKVPSVDPIATAAVSRMLPGGFADFDCFMISLCTFTFP